MNAQSIVNKMLELNGQVLELKPDLVAIVETWTHPDIYQNNAFLNIDGYFIVDQCDRTDTIKGRGGGIIVYSRIPNVYSVTLKHNFDQVLHVVISGTNNEPDIHLHVVYKPPSSSDTNINNLIKYVSNIPENSVLVGDFNFPDINWSTLQCPSVDSPFLDMCNDKFLNQLVDFPTNFTPQKNGSVTATCIDLVLTNCNSVASIAPCGQLGASKHSMLSVDLIMPVTENPSFEMIPDYSKADFNEIKLKLEYVDWHTELQNKDTLDTWKLIQEKIFSVVDSSIPKKPRRINNRPLWMNKNIMRTIRKKRRLWKWFCSTRDGKDYNAYTKTRDEVNKAIKRAKRNLEKRLAKDAKSNPKPFYQYMAKQTKCHTRVGPLKDKNGKIQNKDEEMVDMLNQQFTSVFTSEDPNLPTPEQVFFGESPLVTCNILPEMVSAKINRLNPNKAHGPDKIYPRIVKELSDILSCPLSILFNKSLNEGVVLPDWKMANVTSIFKKGDRTSPANYRPISLTSIICRLMESILRDAILHHLKLHNLIRPSQHGFMPKRSCVTNLLEFLEDITRLVDEGHSIDLVYLDFAKAFDKVPHARLLSKVEAHGICGNIAKWIKEWLNDRKQKVVLNGCESKTASVTSGVPQGSVLGPILFVIYIDDIDTAIDTLLVIMKKFADDTKVAAVVDTYEQSQTFQLHLDKIFRWSREWQMIFNVDKCKVMHIGRNNQRFTYEMDGQKLKSTEVEKDIGVYIHQSLTPRVQVAEAAKKANQVLGQLLRTITFRDKVHFVRLYKQRVRCHLEISVQAWSPWLQQDIDILENVQKRAIRNIHGLHGTYAEKLKQIGLTTLEDRRTRGDMIETFKIINNYNDVNPAVWFSHPDSSSTHPTRQTGFINDEGSIQPNLYIKTPVARLNLRKGFFSHRVVSSWNKLPLHVQNASSVNSFKTLYDNWFNLKCHL